MDARSDPFVTQVNRATSATLRLQATQEGLVPLKAWIKSMLDCIIQVCMQRPDLEFAWVGDDAVDTRLQAQTLQILVGAGIKTTQEARAAGTGQSDRWPEDAARRRLLSHARRCRAVASRDATIFAECRRCGL